MSLSHGSNSYYPTQNNSEIENTLNQTCIVKSTGSLKLFLEIHRKTIPNVDYSLTIWIIGNGSLLREEFSRQSYEIKHYGTETVSAVVNAIWNKAVNQTDNVFPLDPTMATKAWPSIQYYGLKIKRP